MQRLDSVVKVKACDNVDFYTKTCGMCKNSVMQMCGNCELSRRYPPFFNITEFELDRGFKAHSLLLGLINLRAKTSLPKRVLLKISILSFEVVCVRTCGASLLDCGHAYHDHCLGS